MDKKVHKKYKKLLLGTIPGDDDKKIKGSKLPTMRQVLLCLLSNLKDLHWDQALSATIENVLLHYQKANIPTLEGRNNIGRVIKDYYEKEFISLMELKDYRRREDEPRIIKLKSELNLTMKFYKNTVLTDIVAKKKGITKVEQDAIDVDIEFMKSMLNDRVATYSGLDKVVTEKTKKRIERQKHHLEREEINPCKRAFEMINLEPGTSSCEDENIEEVTTIAQSRKHRKLVKCGIDIFVPHDILKNPDLVSCSIRNNISSTQLSAIVHSLVAACGGDLYKLCLNPRTAHRYRTAIVPEISLKKIGCHHL